MIWKTQAEAKRQIQHLIDTNDRAVYRALLVVFENQTSQEQHCGRTVENNCVGFSSWDAEFLTDMVANLKKYGHLTEKQLAVTRNKIRRYWKQLMVASKEKVAA